jgi:lysophospholipase L1-like esterase
MGNKNINNRVIVAHRATVRAIACGAVIVAMGGAFARAADCNWTGKTDGNWSTVENWADGKKPAEQDIAVFGEASNYAVSLDSDAAVGGITFTESAGTYTISDHAISLANGGSIHKARGKTVQVQTIASDIHIADTAAFSCDDKRFENFNNMLALKGHIQGSGNITVTGTDGGCGGVDLAADNHDTFTGSITLNSGLLLLQESGAMGSGKLPITLNGGQFMCFGGVHTDNAFHITGKVNWESSGENSHSGAIEIDPKAVWTIGNGGGNHLTLGGVISGAGSIHMVCGNTTLSGSESNTFSAPLNFTTDSDTEAYDKLHLAKTGGAIAVGAPIELHKKANIILEGDDEISSKSPVLLDGGKLSFNGHGNHLGILTLNDAAEIDLNGGKSTAHFADCHSAKWGAKGQLLIHGWAEGGDAKIFFGASGSALTPAQLAQIGFDTPAGKTTGIYRAKISAKGELSPTDTATVPANTPFDVSAEADKAREAIYSVDGLGELTGPGTPLKADTKISVFGDSITWLNTYLNVMRHAIAKSDSTKDLNVTLFNHGINGGGVLQVRDGSNNASFNGKDNNGPQDAFAKVIEADKANVAVVYIGINDVWWRKTSQEDFEKALRDIVDSAKANKTTLVLVTMAMHGEKPDGSNGDDKKIEAFCKTEREVAESTGTTLVDLRKDYIAYLQNHNRQMHIDGSLSYRPNNFLTYDGVHPNAAGAKFLANQISDGIYRALKAGN